MPFECQIRDIFGGEPIHQLPDAAAINKIVISGDKELATGIICSRDYGHYAFLTNNRRNGLTTRGGLEI